MTRTPIVVGNALDLPGYPISAAVATDGLVHTAGLIAIDPVTGAVVEGDVTVQTNQVLDNLEAVLAASGVGLADLVFVDVVLSEVERDFAAFNAAYSARVLDAPARRTVGARLALPGLLVEINAVATRNGSDAL